MLEQCGSEGGCAFYVDLIDRDGSTRTGEVGVTSGAESNLPPRLKVGRYTVTFRSSLVSDVIVNGSPPGQSPDASCTATFEVSADNSGVLARGVFRADSCEVVITPS
jgi:hypothetical protein